MIYLKEFETIADYNAVKDNLEIPHVALRDGSYNLRYKPLTPPEPIAIP